MLIAILFTSASAVTVVNNTCYGAVFDAAPLYTKVNVFQWPCRGSQSYPQVDMSVTPPSLKITPGLQTQYPDQVAAYLTPLFNFMSQTIPAAQKSISPIFLGGSAGMRLLQLNLAANLIDAVRQAFNSSGYYYQLPWARVLSGVEQAAFQWLSVNYLLHSITGNSSIVGDLGQGSLQIAYQTPNQSINQNIMTLQYPTVQSIFSISYLGYGVDGARIAVTLMSGSLGSTTIASPCYPSGYSSSWADNSSYTITGLGSPSDCINLINQYLNSTCRNVTKQFCQIEQVVSPQLPNQTAYLQSNYLTLAQFFGMSPTFTLNDLYGNITQYTSLSWSQIQANTTYASNANSANYYFMSIYAYQTLSYALNFASNQVIVVGTTINNYPTYSWPLAFLQYQLAAIPCTGDSPSCYSVIISIMMLWICM